MKWKEYVSVAAIIIVLAGIIAAALGAQADWRLMSVLLIILGAIMYVVLGPDLLPERSGWYAVSTVFSMFAVIIAFMGIVVASPWLFGLSAVCLAVLWSIMVADRVGLLFPRKRIHKQKISHQ